MNLIKKNIIGQIEKLTGNIKKIGNSLSLLQLDNGKRVYFRYSKIHVGKKAFYGLRSVDLNHLDGFDSYICFSTDFFEPVFVPYADFEYAIRQSTLASDGQYKAQLIFDHLDRVLYLPKIGMASLESYGGIETIANSKPIDTRFLSLNHWQVQTLLGSIGVMKGYNVYVPLNNIELLDWDVSKPYSTVRKIPDSTSQNLQYANEIDVLWIEKDKNTISAGFEVEHSTPIYSGLLRFNDLMLSYTNKSRFFVVSNESRRDLFIRQLQRPTFSQSGLGECTSFLDYKNIFDWHERLLGKKLTN